MKNTFYFLLVAILFVACQKDEEDQFKGDSGEFTDTRDNQTYNWVRIGDQIWMAENLHLPKVSPPAGESYTNPIIIMFTIITELMWQPPN